MDFGTSGPSESLKSLELTQRFKESVRWCRALELRSFRLLGGRGLAPWQLCVSKSYIGVKLESCKRKWSAERTDEQIQRKAEL